MMLIMSIIYIFCTRVQTKYCQPESSLAANQVCKIHLLSTKNLNNLLNMDTEIVPGLSLSATFVN